MGRYKRQVLIKIPNCFFGAIGGYGGIGVIVEATLNLEKNSLPQFDLQACLCFICNLNERI